MFGTDENTLLNDAIVDSNDIDASVSADTAAAKVTETDNNSDDGVTVETVVDGAVAETKPDDVDPAQDQSSIDKRFAKITAEKHALRAKAETAEKGRVEAQQELDKLKLAASTPVNAPHPDLAYTDPEEFQKQTAEYLDSRVKSQTDAIKLEAQQKITEDNEHEYRKATYERLDKTAQELGISAEEMDRSAQVILSSGVSDNLRDMLVEHEVGPALMSYLAKNEGEFHNLNAIGNPLILARSLDALQEQAVTRKTSSAPEPLQKISGSSAKEQDEFDKALPGAKIE